jgi:putative ABC transport system ATP-binding protein
LRSLPESGKRSVVMVTHDRTAAAYGDRIVTIRDGLLADESRDPRTQVTALTG